LLFSFHAPPTTEIYTLSLHDALPIFQTRDLLRADPQKWRVVTRKQPSPEEMEALQFAWIVVKHLKSNAIALAHKDVTVGMGMGQDRKSTRLNSSHSQISYAVFCLKKK